MRPVELLRELADDVGARRIGEPLELAQMLVERLAGARALERRAHEQRPLDGRCDGDQFACDAQILVLATELPPSALNRPVELNTAR